MAYCTQAQFVTKFGELELIQLTDHAQIGTVDVTVLASAQAAADSDINKRLRKRGWTVPVTATPDIVAIALDITRFYLYSNQEIEIVTNAFKRRIKELDDFAAGVIMLDIGEPDTQASSAGDVDFVQSERIFNADSLTGF